MKIYTNLPNNLAKNKILSLKKKQTLQTLQTKTTATKIYIYIYNQRRIQDLNLDLLKLDDHSTYVFTCVYDCSCKGSRTIVQRGPPNPLLSTLETRFSVPSREADPKTWP